MVSTSGFGNRRGEIDVTQILGRIVLYSILVVGAFASFFPFYWMLTLATRKATEIFRFPPPLLPGTNFLVNYKNMVDTIPFWINMFNSAFVATTHTALVLLFCSMGGYAFAMYRFPGREKLFLFMLSTMMVPWMAGIIPWFILMRWFRWINSFKALIIPGAANAFGIFWMRQYISSTVPGELLDAARVDGCPEYLIFFRVVFPLLKPALSALGIMTFMGSWNNFMGPLLVLKERTKYTLPVALSALRGDPSRGFDYGILMIGTALAMLPILVVFVLAAKRFMAGLTAGALKG
ncbi:MAG: carbohydrate ABC transporter permease [bacterium]